MLDVLTSLFDPTGFNRRADCGTAWTPGLIGLYATSDLFIWLAYVSIPLVLLYFTRRRDLPFPRLFVLFALFILACGTTHLLDALMFRYPVYRFLALMKALTAVVSWATVFALIQVIPRVVPLISEGGSPVAASGPTAGSDEPRAGTTRGYIVAVLAAVLAILVRGVLDPLLRDDHIFVVALLAVVYVSWQHGFRAAVLTLVIGVGGYSYFFVPTRNSFVIDGLGNQMAITLFFFCGIGCAALGESQRVAQRRARAALATALARQGELEAEVARRQVVETALRQREGELTTARDQTAAALARLDAFLDNAPVGIVFFDPQLRYEKINAFLAAANGKPVSEHLGRTLVEVRPDFPPDLVRAYRRIAAGETDVFAGTRQDVDAATGQTRAWQITAFPVRRPDGHPLGVGVVAHDVTEQKRAAAELAEKARATELRADVATVLAAAGETKVALRGCADTLVRSLGAAFARIWTTDAAGEWLELQASAGMYTHTDGPHGRVRVGDFKIGRIARTATPHLTNDVQHDPNVGDPAWAAREGMQSFVGYPLVVEGRVLGVMALFARAKLSDSLMADLGPVAASIAEHIDRRRAGAALHESEARKSAMLESALDCVIAIDHESRVIEFNPAAERAFHYTRAEALGRDLADLVIPPEFHDKHRVGMARYLATGEGPVLNRLIELVARRRDGSLFPVELSITPIRGDGPPIFTSYLRDISNRKRAEEARRANEERYRTLTEAVPHVVWNADAHGEVTYFNQRWLEHTALPVDEARGRGWMAAVHPDDRDRVYAAWRDTVESPSGHADRFAEEFRLLHAATGAYRWFQSVAVPLRHADGRVDQWIGSMADINDQKAAIEAVRENDAFRRGVFENSPDCLKILDLTGRMLEMNQSGCDLTEIDDFSTHQDVPWSDLWPAANRETIREAVSAARGGHVGRFQGFCPTVKGTPKYWDVSVAPLPGADGRPVRLLAVSRDVTEQRRADERIRESEELFRQMAESIPQLAWMTEPDGSIFWYNQRWYDYTGTTFDEMKGWGWKAVHDPAEVDRVAANFKAHLASGEPWEDTFPIRGRDGKFRWHLSRARPIRDPLGNVTRWFGTNTDISAQRELAETLRASEERFRTLTEAVPQIVWTADPQGRVTFFNRRWAEYTGAGLEAGRTYAWGSDQLHPDDADQARVSWQLAVLQQAGGYSEEFRLRRADGAYRWFLSTAVPLAAAGAAAEWVGTLTDVDDQKRARENLEREVRDRTAALEQANESLVGEIAVRTAAEDKVRTVAVELERSNGELEKFAYIASHDLQEPLRKIQAFGDRLVTKCRDVMPEKGKEYIDRMLTAAGRMRRLIDDLLTFSRVTSQQRPPQRLDLSRLVREVVSDLEVRIGQAKATVNVGVMPPLDADPTQMRQLFQNLIANAVKFHKPDVPPVVDVTAELVDPPAKPDAVVADDGPPWCRITVRDNGIGFDEKYRDRIFEVFQRLHGREEYEGTGVGLAVCRKIAERHGGMIEAHGKPGEGAAFVVTIPARHSNSREGNEDDAKPEQTNHDPDGG